MKRHLAEGLGTMLLVATVVGSGVMGGRLAGGNVAVALWANTFATVAVLFVLVTVLGPVSGAHFNPAVTLIAMARKQLPVGEGVVRIGVQIAGGVTGTLLAHAMFELAPLQRSTHARTGPSQWLAEVVATFGLVLIIEGAVKHQPRHVAACVAAWIGAAYWFTASTSFANPAVTIARSLTDTFAGIQPADVPGFIVAQLAGAAAGAAVASKLFAEDKHA